MARLDSKSDTQLIYLAGSLIETLNDSMRGGNRISRENDANKAKKLDSNIYTNNQTVVIKTGQERIINQFMTLVGQRSKTLAVNLDLETSDPSNKRIKFRDPKLIVIIRRKIKKGIIKKTPPIVGVSLFL